MTGKGVTCLLLLGLLLNTCQADTRYFVKMRTNASELFKTRSESNLRSTEDTIGATKSPLHLNVRTGSREQDERMIRDPSSSQFDRRNSFETSTFNPDVLNKFLEEYANRIKSTTERGSKYPFRIVKPSPEPLVLEVDDETTQPPVLYQQQNNKFNSSSTVNESDLTDVLNDTVKRNKYYGANSHDDRNGWVTLEAIPWSKSKISKWQANPSTQRPWPEIKPWDKPSMAKPWTSEYPRPTYENNKPSWYEKPKPNWPDNEKPWQKPSQNTRPYVSSPDKYEVTSQTQKWPPERPWDKYSHRPDTDIITDEGPANFPTNNWNRPSKPYQFMDRYPDKIQEDNDWNDYPSRFEYTKDRPRPITERPNFSQYQYVNTHPPTHPANGDGQWVLLSTNRGYSKTRQRSIKLDALNPEGFNVTRTKGGKKEKEDPTVPVMTSKRQVRLTVLPSINGTNTTTSHGGLLEVERTFKSVEQSKREYEMERQSTEIPAFLKRRPIRNTVQPSSSAVLAAVGAGMLPATMAMMIPMMLGRRKRDLSMREENATLIKHPFEIANSTIHRSRFLRL